MTEQLGAALRVLRLKQVIDRCGLGRSTIYARIKEGTFPSQVVLGARAVGWIEQSINQWIEHQIAAGRKIAS